MIGQWIRKRVITDRRNYLIHALILSCPINFLFLTGYSNAMPPEGLFGKIWSEGCADKVGAEVNKYITFESTRWCEHSGDTFPTDKHCDDVTWVPLSSNKVGATIKGQGRYIIEFLWSTKLSVMMIKKADPLELEQLGTLGLVTVRKGLKTDHLHCP